MKALIIDPFVISVEDGQLHISDKPPIREVEFDGDINSINFLLTAPGREVRFFDAVRMKDSTDAIYVDDEGMFRALNFFMVEDITLPIAGKGLLLGTDDEGGSIAPETTTESLWSRVRIGLANLEVRLADLDVGAPVDRSAITLRNEAVAKEWAVEYGVWA